MLRSALVLIGWLLTTAAAAAIGGLASRNASSFYAELARPSWSPPAWLFGPVWTLLYIMMGVAAWLVWREGGWSAARTALTLFIVQLIFNAAWSWLFFAMRRGDLAFYEIIVLLVLIIATIVSFWPVSKVAAVLMMPYLAWVMFASVLNFTIWRMNLAKWV